MWSITIIVAAFAAALVVMSLTFMGGAVVVAVPLALIGVAVSGALDFQRRRKQLQKIQHHNPRESVDFTERDRETLISEAHPARQSEREQAPRRSAR